LLIPVGLVLMVLFERRRDRALSFLRVIPQFVPPGALLLPPTCALGGLLALAALPVLPWLAAVALFGCWCWAAAVGHRFATRGSWVLGLVALPLAYAGLIAVAVTCAAGGWAACAVVSLALGLAGCIAPLPAAWFTTRAMPRTAASPRGEIALPVDTAVRRPAAWAPQWTTFQILAATVRARPGWSMLPLVALSGLALSWLEPMRGVRFGLLWASNLTGLFLGANALAVREFLHVRPLGGRLPFLQTLLPWLLLMLIIPAASLARVLTVDRLPGEDVALVVRHRPSDAASASRAATAIAAQRREEIPVVVSPSLRRLLALDVLRIALFQLAVFFLFCALGVRGKSGARWTRMDMLGGLVVLLLCPFALQVLFPRFPLKLPSVSLPLWFAAVCAGSSAFALRRRLMLPQAGGSVSCSRATSETNRSWDR
jgi:hypothetical protein